MPGGVGGDRSAMIGPYPDWYEPGVVGSNPASRAKFKDLAPQNQVLHVTVGPCGTVYPHVPVAWFSLVAVFDDMNRPATIRSTVRVS
jgi:hypothetical protein